MKLYVLVRSDLSKSHQAVQAGHAVAEFCRSFPDSEWKHRTLVYLKAGDESELTTWLEIVRSCEKEIEMATFREPYWNNSLTAAAILGTDMVSYYLKELKML